MEHKASKLGSAVAAAVLGLGLPAAALADPLPAVSQSDQDIMTTVDQVDQIDQDTTAPQFANVTDAVASMDRGTQALAALGPISADDLVVVSLSDLGMGSDQATTVMQGIDPSNAAALQRAISGAVVAESGDLAGYNRSLSDHLTMLGVDPASVIAVNVDQDGTVTIYHQ